MCGIVGIVTNEKQEITRLLAASLKDLEYRGYDSAGVAILDGKSVLVSKCLGAPSDNLSASQIKESFGKEVETTLGIGHNRWATHGKPSLVNAHPHTNTDGSIAVVHNGTILNFETLKSMLEGKGYVFRSETDTEIIPHLTQMYMEELSCSFYDALKKVATVLEGSFGILAMHSSSPQELVIVKNGSPLCFAEGKGMFVVASSPGALIRYADSFISLDDGESALLDGETMTYQIDSWRDKETQKKRNAKKIEGINTADLEKGDFETYMQKEIHEQPASTMTTMLGRYDISHGDAVLGGIIDFRDKLRDTKHLDIIGCGTAHHAGMIGKELIERIAKMPVTVHVSSEFLYSKNPYEPEDTVVLAVSQSGETADTLESLKEAKKAGYTTLGITNVVGSAIAEETLAGIYTRAGTEVGVASTKAFTAQCSVMYLLALSLARSRGVMSKLEGEAYLETLETIPALMKKILEEKEEIIKKLSEKYLDKKVMFLGKGIHMPIAYESALKYKELTYKECSAYPVGELKHGPIALIDEETVCFVIMPKDEMYSITKNTVEQIKAKGGNVIILTSGDSAEDPINLKADDVVFIPEMKDARMYPLTEILPLQLFIYYTAKLLGRNIDKPRNLAKSVTVQ